MIQRTYQRLIEAKDLNPDAAQSRVVDALQNLYDDLISHPAPSKNLWSVFKKPTSLRGLYIYGGVGRGKSMLMDMFYDQLPSHIPSRRCHFHEFMIETHDYLHEQRGKKVDNILPKYADKVAKDYRVLCFDEFHVTDVADAMILGRLFEALIEAGMVIVTTSNRHPDDLYKGGLQRDRFEPFVAFLKQHMTIMHLDSETDYRQLSPEVDLTQKYFKPLGEPAHLWANKVFLMLLNEKMPKPASLKVKGRTIEIEAAAGKTARFTFAQLCEQPLGAEDFLKIAKTYKNIVLEGVPKLGYDRRNEAKRFMNLIDVFYDQKVNLYITADTTPDKLYRGSHHSFEFDRTISRLSEMAA